MGADDEVLEHTRAHLAPRLDAAQVLQVKHRRVGGVRSRDHEFVTDFGELALPLAVTPFGVCNRFRA